MKNNIVIVALDFGRCLEFGTDSADQQSDLISVAITLAYKQVKRVHPKAWVLIAWREYGSSNKLNLSPEEKFDFKQKMRALIQGRDLTIIAGTILSHKSVTKEKMTQQLADYKKFSFISQMEKENCLFNYYERYQWRALGCKKKEISTKISNTCYRFTYGSSTQRRQKLAPYIEIADHLPKPNFYGFKREQDWLFSLNQTKTSVQIGVEICREHCLGLLKHHVGSKNLPKPTIHFILSDSVDFQPLNACGEVIIHIDSDPSQRVTYYLKPEARETELKVYALLTDQPDPKIMEIFPKILDTLDEQPIQSHKRKRI